MAVAKNPETYVLYTEPSKSGEEKLAVSEEASFDKMYESKTEVERETIQEIGRQLFLIPQVSEVPTEGDLGELIPSDELRIGFVNRAIRSKVSLYISKEMRAGEMVEETDAVSGKKEQILKPTFQFKDEAIDLTSILAEAPKRTRLTVMDKINNVLDGVDPAQRAEFLRRLLAEMEAEQASEESVQ